jgi:hypothetical protein
LDGSCRTHGTDRTHIALLEPDRLPRTPVFEALRREGYSREVLAEAAVRARPENLWKANYMRAVVRNLARERVGR